MHHAPQEKVAPPAHVPPHLVVDFDVYDPPGGARDLHAAWRKLHDGPDIVWAPYHGGYWILTRAADIDYVQRTHDPFSMKDVTMPAGTRPTRLLPLEADPPEHGPFRSIINPWFTPRRIATLENEVQQLAGRLIDGLQPRGTCEFMGEFALHLPIAIFMRLTNLPMEDREKLLAYTQMTTRGTAAERGDAHRLMMEYLGPVIETRRATPGDDLLSAVIHAKVGGAPINDTDMMSVLLVILFGGLDTVASTLGFIAHFLAGSPRHRQELLADPGLIRRAVDEFMRRFSPSNTARTLTRDFDYNGVQFKKDEKIYVPPVLAGMDDRRYPDAFAIYFHRADVAHSSFGAGPHRCPGALLAQLEIKLFLQEWLKRIPDFCVPAGEIPVFGTGQVNCVERLGPDVAGMSGALDALFRLDGKIALVTDSGGCSSIDVAPMLASAGARVIVADRDPQATTDLANFIDPTGKNAMAVPTDIELEASVAALFETVRERFGGLDILVNCAGLTANQALLETSMAQYDAMQSVNLRASFMLMREGVRLMLAAGRGGRIVNITTIGAVHPVLNGNAGYGASRAGVTAMTRAIALDHARDGILANVVMPGAVYGKTRFHETTQLRLAGGGTLTGPAMDRERRLPLGMGTGRDIAAAVLYLAGPSGGYITGQTITLDGGFLLT